MKPLMPSAALACQVFAFASCRLISELQSTDMPHIGNVFLRGRVCS
jgi:hypothetical protein